MHSHHIMQAAAFCGQGGEVVLRNSEWGSRQSHVGVSKDGVAYLRGKIIYYKIILYYKNLKNILLLRPSVLVTLNEKAPLRKVYYLYK